MKDAKSLTSMVRFGTFEVGFESREIRKHGMRIQLEEKPFQILEMLIKSAGQVVERKTLCEKLWPDTYVAFNHSLNTAVNKLRNILGDLAKSPRFIETLPRLGYRFVAPVQWESRNRLCDAGRTLVVLPFENLSGEPGMDRFADGLTEEMTLQLSQLNPEQLGVIARTCAVQYRGRKKSIREIAEELHVDLVLEGSVRREGKHVRIIGQLIETRDQTCSWSASYDRDLMDTVAVQTQVAREIRRAFGVELLPASLPKALAPGPMVHQTLRHIKASSVQGSTRPQRFPA